MGPRHPDCPHGQGIRAATQHQPGPELTPTLDQKKLLIDRTSDPYIYIYGDEAGGKHHTFIFVDEVVDGGCGSAGTC